MPKLKLHSRSEVSEISICNPSKIVSLLNEVFNVEHLLTENVFLLAATTKLDVVGIFNISHGGLDYATIDMRVLFSNLLLCGASSFAVVHNHPSGNPMPSKLDNSMCEHIKQCSDLLMFRFVDFIVIGSDSYYSYIEHGDLVQNKK